MCLQSLPLLIYMSNTADSDATPSRGQQYCTGSNTKIWSRDWWASSLLFKKIFGNKPWYPGGNIIELLLCSVDASAGVQGYGFTQHSCCHDLFVYAYYHKYVNLSSVNLNIFMHLAQSYWQNMHSVLIYIFLQYTVCRSFFSYTTLTGQYHSRAW